MKYSYAKDLKSGLKPAFYTITRFHIGISFWSQSNFGEGFGLDGLGGPSQLNYSMILLTAAFQWPPFSLSACKQLFMQQTTSSLQTRDLLREFINSPSID